MVARHLRRPFKAVCLTDHPSLDMPYGVNRIQTDLPGWWAKMQLFEAAWRAGQQVLYFDLDTVIVGDITPLADVTKDFAICGSFTRAAGHPSWPCRYGSCVMVIGPGAHEDVYPRYLADARKGKGLWKAYGDQKAIEDLLPGAPLLQDILPQGFFMDRRAVVRNRDAKPPGVSVVCFAGPLKPENCDVRWIRDEWEKH